jgi:hypothetical protein
MTDSPHTEDARFVELDDRLLAYVMGLQADPELEAAAATDAVLRRRLEALRTEVAQVAEQVTRAVPEPDAAYTDISQPQWAALRPLMEAEVRDIRPRAHPQDGAWRWLRVLAPVAAVIVALAVGVSVLDRQGTGLFTSQGDKATAELAPARAGGDATSTEHFIDRQAAARFGVVLIARARAARDGFQQFDVVRVLRGTAPDQLRLRVASQPAAVGLLHVLYLSPLASETGGADPTPTDESPSLSPSPSPEPTEAAGGDPGAGPSPYATDLADEILFDDGGETAVAVQMPAGVDANDVSLP